MGLDANAVALSAGVVAWTLAALLIGTRRDSRTARSLSLVLATEGALQIAAILPSFLDGTRLFPLARAVDVLFLTAFVAVGPAYLLLLRELPTPLARPWQGPARERGLRAAYGVTLGAASLLALAMPALVFLLGALGVVSVSLYALACALDAHRRMQRGSPMRQRAGAFLVAFGARDGTLALAALAGLLGEGVLALLLASISTLVYVPLAVVAVLQTDLFLLRVVVRRHGTPARARNLRPIGRGTWLADDAFTGLRVVVKPVPSRDAPACVAGRLGIDQLPRLVDVVDDIGKTWALFAYVDGVTLHEALQGGPLPANRVRRLADDLCAAHLALARAGLVHADITPRNIVLASSGQAVLVDLGSVRASGDPTPSLGTARYLAPEQARGRPPDGQADQYAIGLCVWEASTGQPYLDLQGDAADLHVRAAFPGAYRPPPQAPPLLDAWLRTTLAPSPNDRFPDARALQRALQRS